MRFPGVLADAFEPPAIDLVGAAIVYSSDALSPEERALLAWIVVGFGVEN